MSKNKTHRESQKPFRTVYLDFTTDESVIPTIPQLVLRKTHKPVYVVTNRADGGIGRYLELPPSNIAKSKKEKAKARHSIFEEEMPHPFEFFLRMHEIEESDDDLQSLTRFMKKLKSLTGPQFSEVETLFIFLCFGDDFACEPKAFQVILEAVIRALREWMPRCAWLFLSHQGQFLREVANQIVCKTNTLYQLSGFPAGGALLTLSERVLRSAARNCFGSARRFPFRLVELDDDDDE